MTYRSAAFIFITLTTYFGLWWCALPVFVVYIYKYRAFDLVVAAIVLDAGFGAFEHIPYYSIITLCTISILECIKPRLMFYTEYDVVS